MKIEVGATIELKNDGTLVIHVREGADIKRIMVIADDHHGDVFYPDED